MIRKSQISTLSIGVLLGALISMGVTGSVRPVAAGNDRHDNYILCTGAAGSNPRSPFDGVWLLDYKSGKLLATMVDRTVGKTVGFAETDLVNEFGLTPNQNVHFLMTTGAISSGQAALYLAETTTGKFAVYTMGPAQNGETGVTILRHDITNFRPAPK